MEIGQVAPRDNKNEDNQSDVDDNNEDGNENWEEGDQWWIKKAKEYLNTDDFAKTIDALSRIKGGKKGGKSYGKSSTSGCAICGAMDHWKNECKFNPYNKGKGKSKGKGRGKDKPTTTQPTGKGNPGCTLIPTNRTPESDVGQEWVLLDG